MLSASLLADLTMKLYSSKRDTMTIGQFYDDFGTHHDSQRFRPFNEGVILSFLYWVMIAKENWEHLIPEDDLSAWGINPSRLESPKYKDPTKTHTLKYLVRRLRNALGHGNVSVRVPLGATQATMMTDTTISFYDENRKDKADTFDATLTLKDAFEVARKLHQIIHTDVSHSATA
jgi:hypothetical protein